MKIDDTLQALEAVADKKGIKVSYEALGGELGGGGLCKVKGEYRVIMDKRATPGERVALLAESLARFPLDDVFIAPEVRELIARSVKGRPTSGHEGKATGREGEGVGSSPMIDPEGTGPPSNG